MQRMRLGGRRRPQLHSEALRRILKFQSSHLYSRKDLDVLETSRCGRPDCCYVRFRTYQMIPETSTQHRVEATISSDGREFDRNLAISNANTNNPMLPIAAPAASTPTAFLARTAPCNPSRSFFSFSCRSIRVADAGKIAGNARKRPPMDGPYFRAMIPVAAVTNPPNKNRTAI